MLSFKNWFFSQLPYYFKDNDSYKDSAGEGLLERYLRNMGVEIDDGLIPFIENFVNCVDVSNCDNKFLNDIAYTLGNPPDPFLDDDKYRYLLEHIVSVYKIKGTKKSYILFFSLLGINVNLVEYEPTEIIFDDGHLMDEPESIFDTNCPSCSDYSLFLSFTTNDCSDPSSWEMMDQTTINIIKATIPFLEPINAHLLSITNQVKICETINICMPQQITFNILDYNTFDEGLEEDDGLFMDEPTIVSTTTITLDCSGSGNPTGIGYMIIQQDNKVA